MLLDAAGRLLLCVLEQDLHRGLVRDFYDAPELELGRVLVALGPDDRLDVLGRLLDADLHGLDSVLAARVERVFLQFQGLHIVAIVFVVSKRARRYHQVVEYRVVLAVENLRPLHIRPQCLLLGHRQLQTCAGLH